MLIYMKKFVLFLIIGIVLVVGCSKEDLKVDNALPREDDIIIDVRTKEEYDELHVKKAINIPYNDIDENIQLDKTKTIFVYCKSGARSRKAYDILKELGYNVIDLGSIDSISLEKEY